MTRVEEWLKQKEYVKEALEKKKELCVREGCITLEKGKPRDGAFCGHFWQVYCKIAKSDS